MKSRINTRKIVGISLWLALIILSFYVFAREAYSYLPHLISIILFSFFTCADLFIRPISAQKDEFKLLISAVLFLLIPFVLVLPFYENQVLTTKYLSEVISKWMYLFGIGCLTTGGCLTLIGRIHLGTYGSSKIVLEDEHKLITDGIYRYIRHPMYLGFLLLFFGFSLSFQSLILTLLIVTGLFAVFRRRMDMEERLLGSLFGKEYESYVKRTRRLIPWLY